MPSPSSQTTWTRCVTHSAVFPSGWEDSHRAGPLGEQNAPGACVFEPDEAQTGMFSGCFHPVNSRTAIVADDEDGAS